MIDIEDQDEQAQASAVPVDPRKNLKPKHVIKVAKNGIPGDVAHYHKKEDERFTWDEPCYFVEHRIHDKAGIKLNEERYLGKVIVPQCTADWLAWRESEQLRYEQGIFRSNKINRRVASL